MGRGGVSAEHIFISLKSRHDLKGWAEALCRGAAESTSSRLAAFYRIPRGKKNPRWAYFTTKMGYVPVPERLPLEREDLQIAMETGLTVVQNCPHGPFPDLLLSQEMRSGIAIRTGDDTSVDGLLILNHGVPFHYSADAIMVLEKLSSLLGSFHGGLNG